MTVENQIPSQSFTANGFTTVFAINFIVEGKDNIKVMANDAVVTIDAYNYDSLTNSIVFNIAPAADTAIKIERITTVDRSINYATYNNSFRPETLNYDIDRIIRILQEQGYTDSVIINDLAQEIYERSQQNVELRGQIEDHTLSLTTIQKIQQDEINKRINGDKEVAIASRAYTDFMLKMNNTNPSIFSGIADNIVITSTGETQKQLNDITAIVVDSITDLDSLTAWEGRNVHVKSYLKDQDKGGDLFVYKGDLLGTNNGITIFNGWVRTGNSSSIKASYAGVSSLAVDNAIALTRLMDYVNSLPNDGTPLVIDFEDLNVKYSNELYFSRPVTLIGNKKATLEHTGVTDYALVLGDKTLNHAHVHIHDHYQIDGINFRGANTVKKHGIYIPNWILQPRITNCAFINYGAYGLNQYGIFCQCNNWNVIVQDNYFSYYDEYNHNLFRANGVGLDGIADGGNSRVQWLNNWGKWHGYSGNTGKGIVLSGSKSVVSGNGFEHSTAPITILPPAHSVDISNFYVEMARGGAFLTIGEEGYKPYGDITYVISSVVVDSVYANLHNNSEYNFTSKFIEVADSKTVIHNLYLDKINALNAFKYPLINLTNNAHKNIKVGVIEGDTDGLVNKTALSGSPLRIQDTTTNLMRNTSFNLIRRSGLETEKIINNAATCFVDGWILSTDTTNCVRTIIKQAFNDGSHTKLDGNAENYARILLNGDRSGKYVVVYQNIQELNKIAGNLITYQVRMRAKYPTDVVVNGLALYPFGSASLGENKVLHLTTEWKQYKLVFYVQPANTDVKVLSETQLSIQTVLNGVVGDNQIDICNASLAITEGSYAYNEKQLSEQLNISEYYCQSGIEQYVGAGQKRGYVKFSKEMARTPTVNVQMVYQDGLTQIPQPTIIADTRGFTYTLSNTALDYNFNWTADAELY